MFPLGLVEMTFDPLTQRLISSSDPKLTFKIKHQYLQNYDIHTSFRCTLPSVSMLTIKLKW